MSSNFTLIKSVVYALLTAAFFLNFASFVFAAPGELDPTFGTGGRVLTRFPISSTMFKPRAEAQALLIQPDGKIVAVGFARRDETLTEDFALARYNADGTLDTAFGNGGRVRTQINLQANARAGALQADGKIVAAGFTYLGPDNWAFALARYLPNGSLDAAFGSGGKVVTDFFGRMDQAAAVAVQPDGKIVAAGFARREADLTDDFALARHTADGSLDTTFGTGGKITTDFFSSSDLIEAMILQPDGRIVAAGLAYSPNVTEGDFALARYNADGSLDASFGTGGKVNTPFTQNFDEYASALVIQPDNKLIAAGRANRDLNGANPDFAVARYNSDGTLDATFDGDGKFINDFAGNNQFDFANAAAIQGNGKILVAGVAFHNNGADDFATLRLNPNGSIDTSFNGNGKILTDFGPLNGGGFTGDQIYGIKIQPDGKIVVAGDGETEPNRQHDFVLARYTGDAPIAPRNKAYDFDGDGKADVSVFRPSDGYWYIAKSSGGYLSIPWGISSDTPVAGDYDGDGKTDLAVCRSAVINQSNLHSWYILKSSDNTYIVKRFGDEGGFTYSFITAPADYDGDGKTDLATVKRFTTSIPAPDIFRVALSLTESVVEKVLDTHYDRIIRSADYDGDGKADFTTVKNGIWTIVQTSNGITRTEHFGFSSDKFVPADYDGDGKVDVAVWRPSNGYWFWISSLNNSFNAYQFGLSDDKPTPADYDGDGKTDVAVFRPTNGMWYLQQSTAGFRSVQFGLSTDTPIPNVFIY